MDVTDLNSNSGRIVTISSKPDPILVNYMQYSPKNEGEASTYTFSFIPTHKLTES